MDKSAQAQEYIAQGMSLVEAAMLTGLSETELEPLVTLAPLAENAKKGIELEDILKWAKKGLLDKDIAKLLGCSRANITERLAPYKEKIRVLPSYKEHKADIFNLVQRDMLAVLTPDAIKKMSAKDALWGVAVLEDKIRALEGKDVKVALNLSKVIHEIHQVHTPPLVEPKATPSASSNEEEPGGAPGG